MAASFLTSCEAKVKIKLPVFNAKSQISAPFHVTDQKSNFNVIFVRDLLRELGIYLDFQNNFVGWKTIKISMKPIHCTLNKEFDSQESKNVMKSTNIIKKILDVSYEKANLKILPVNYNI